MTKIKYLILAFILVLIPNLKVNAASDLYVSLNNSSLTTRGYSVVSANSWSTFVVSGLYDSEHSYYRMSLCFDGKITQNSISSTNVSTISNIYVEKTSISCSYYNSSYSGGTWTNIYFNAVNVINSNNIATFSVLSTGGSFGLISMSSSSEPFDYMTSQDNSEIIKGNEDIKNSINDLEDSIINNNSSDAITNSLNSCGTQYKYKLIKGQGFNANGTMYDSKISYYTEDFYSLDNATSLTLKGFGSQAVGYILLYDANYNFIDYWGVRDRYIEELLPTAKYFKVSTSITSGMIFKGECTNKLDEAENTRKGIWETIKSFPSTFSNFFKDLGDKIGGFFTNLLNGILDGLKSLFIPGDGFFKTWFSDFKTFIEDKLGFLSTPFTIFIDFIESYSNLSSSNDIVINIPDITVPNFEDYKIISATTFNWSQTLKSKTSLLNLWNLYLDFIDVFLILNFIGLCERTYNRIFGGDTSNYEYYTTENSYNVDNETGEVLSTRHNERTTVRKKVE